jgi:hypothetical protein
VGTKPACVADASIRIALPSIYPGAASALHAKNDVHDLLHYAEPLRAEPLRPVTLHVDLLSDCQGVIDLDAEVAHRTLNFRMAQ